MSEPIQDLDLGLVRAQFPALRRSQGGRPVAYLDGPGGTQVPQSVIEAMASLLQVGVSNLGGGFGASMDAERAMAAGRQAMAHFFNADPAEIVFGQNMTSLTFSMSRALARTWSPGDAIVVTSLDHDANFTPWTLAAEDRGVEVRVAEFDVTNGLLEPSAITSLLDERVRLVAVCLASNSLGSLVDVAAVARAAHEVGSLVYVDAVHAGPHRLIDVEALRADFLVASAYKFFGPHTGVLFGKLGLLTGTGAYKARPAPSDPPGKWETGTQSFESIAGVAAAVDYLADLGEGGSSQGNSLKRAFDAIRRHEHRLGSRFVDGVANLEKIRIFGEQTMDDQRRVATFAIAVDGVEPSEVARRMAGAGLYVWSGHYYALNVMRRLQRLDRGGLVRIGFVHYNTEAEVDRVLEVLDGF